MRSEDPAPATAALATLTTAQAMKRVVALAAPRDYLARAKVELQDPIDVNCALCAEPSRVPGPVAEAAKREATDHPPVYVCTRCAEIVTGMVVRLEINYMANKLGLLANEELAHLGTLN